MTLGPEVQVSLAHAGVPHFESHISVDPRDPQHLLVVSITLADGGAGLASCSTPWCSPTSAAFVSFDGGRTWSSVPLDGCDGIDPRTVFDVALAVPIDENTWGVEGRSRDNVAGDALGGDYSGLVAGPDGRFHVVWADSRTGVYQLWTRSVVSGDR